MANNSVRYPPELRERAVRMVLEATREGVYSSEWAAICAVAQMLGPTPETVRKWVRRAQAAVSGPSADHRRRVVELERENRELRRANEILKAASAFGPQEVEDPFAREPQPPPAPHRTGNRKKPQQQPNHRTTDPRPGGRLGK